MEGRDRVAKKYIFSFHINFQAPFDMNGVRDCEEKKGLLSSCPKTKEVEEETELKQMWEKEGGWEQKEGGGGREEEKRNTSSPHNGIEAGKQAGCWVSEQTNFLA